MFWLQFTVLFLTFGLYSFSTTSDNLQNENQDSTVNSSDIRNVFHEIHGYHIELSHRGTVATRSVDSCLGITFTKRPVKVNELIYVKILKTTASRSGWLQIGFTGNDPSTLKSFMYKCMNPYRIDRTWSKEVDESYAAEESVFSYYVDERGVVHYGRLEEDKVLFTGVNTSSDLWAVLYLYGQTVSVQLLDRLENDNKDSAASSSGLGIVFHETHGKDIVLSRRGTIATRTEGNCRAMTFTSRPVKVNERIYVKILKTTSYVHLWMEIGLTETDPSTLKPFLSDCLSAYEVNRTWAKEIAQIYTSEGSVFSYYVDERGVFHYGKPDEEEDYFSGVDTSSFLWSVFTVRYQTVSIQLLGNSSFVLSVPGVEASRESGISYLMSLRNTEWGWAEDTHRAIVALYLSGATAFNGTDLEPQLMAKELELQMYLALSRNTSVPLSASELALYINALLVTCHNPRNFHGFDLIALLKKEIRIKGNATHPFVYIALCNANETMSPDTVSFLNSMLEYDSNYFFWTDFRAMAVMALSCNLRRNGNSPNADPNITSAVNDLMQLQHPDGSFGSIYTSALIVQALLASGHERDPNWDVYGAVSYFQSKQNSSDGQSFGDFLATYLILPILNEKSLVDVAQVNCPNRKDGNVTNFKDNIVTKTSKIRVQYSRYLGDNMEAIHSLSLNVPSNITVLDVMNLAAKENPKFKFEYKTVSGKIHVYSVGNVAIDPEKGMFWFLYLSTKENEKVISKTESPDKISLSGGEHIIMWYKAADNFM